MFLRKDEVSWLGWLVVRLEAGVGRQEAGGGTWRRRWRRRARRWWRGREMVNKVEGWSWTEVRLDWTRVAGEVRLLASCSSSTVD